MRIPPLKRETIYEALITPHSDVIRLNPDTAAHHLKIVDGVVLMNPKDTVYTVHEVGHFLTRDPAGYFALEVDRLNYGFKAPVTFEGGLRMIRNELCAFAITDVLYWHLAGKKFEPKPRDGSAIGYFDLVAGILKKTWPETKIEKIGYIDRLELYKVYHDWLRPADDLLWWWGETIKTLRRLAQNARASPNPGGDAPSPSV